MQSSTHAEAAARRRPAVLPGAFNSAYIGSKTEPGPQAFLVEGDPGYTIKPHYHGVNQFQVIVRGGGRIGKNQVRPGVLHYADMYTPYGPIVAGDEGLAFFTLRQESYPVAHYVPGAKEEKLKPTGRNIVTASDPARARTTGLNVLIDQEDGARVYELSAGPGDRLPDPDARARHGAAYVLVIGGSVTVDGKRYDELSLLHLADNEPTPALRAQDEGAVALFLSFPVAKDGAP